MYVLSLEPGILSVTGRPITIRPTIQFYVPSASDIQRMHEQFPCASDRVFQILDDDKTCSLPFQKQVHEHEMAFLFTPSLLTLLKIRSVEQTNLLMTKYMPPNSKGVSNLRPSACAMLASKTRDPGS
jgi:hypothetical protein